MSRLTPHRPAMPDVRRFIYHPVPGEIPPAEEVGGKARNLARLAGLGFEVPPWIVVTAAAFDEYDGGQKGLPLYREAKELLQALADAGLRDALLAVRSSAVVEDGAEASFAGQFDSVLGVVPGADGRA